MWVDCLCAAHHKGVVELKRRVRAVIEGEGRRPGRHLEATQAAEEATIRRIVGHVRRTCFSGALTSPLPADRQ